MCWTNGCLQWRKRLHLQRGKRARLSADVVSKQSVIWIAQSLTRLSIFHIGIENWQHWKLATFSIVHKSTRISTNLIYENWWRFVDKIHPLQNTTDTTKFLLFWEHLSIIHWIWPNEKDKYHRMKDTNLTEWKIQIQPNRIASKPENPSGSVPIISRAYSAKNPKPLGSRIFLWRNKRLLTDYRAGEKVSSASPDRNRRDNGRLCAWSGTRIPFAECHESPRKQIRHCRHYNRGRRYKTSRLTPNPTTAFIKMRW